MLEDSRKNAVSACVRAYVYAGVFNKLSNGP